MNRNDVDWVAAGKKAWKTRVRRKAARKAWDTRNANKNKVHPTAIAKKNWKTHVHYESAKKRKAITLEAWETRIAINCLKQYKTKCISLLKKLEGN